jgi:ATP-dependent DNA helicase UvrD/PcrA
LPSRIRAAVVTARTWSAQQQAIFEWFENANGAPRRQNSTVIARAGTGKTTTIIEAVRRAPERRVLVAAFNTRIKDEIAAKLQTTPGTDHVEVKTLHAIGFACVRNFWEGIRAEDRNAGRRDLSRAEQLAQAVCGDQAPDAAKRAVAKLCTLGREIAPLATKAGDLVDVMLEHDLMPDAKWNALGYGADFVEDKALKAMHLAATVKPRAIDFADMLFLPVRNRWTPKLWDLGVVDEAQDMTLTQLSLFLGVVGGRVCVVGDNRQAIYGFRGADSDSLDRLRCELDADVMGLTTTYRCPKTVVAYARTLVPDYQAAPEAPEGLILRIPFADLVNVAENKVDANGHSHDFILSRTNAALAAVAMALIRAQKRVRIQGRDIGAGLIALVNKLAVGKAKDSLPEFFAKLTAWQEREIVRAEKADRGDLVAGIVDKVETIRCVADGATGVPELNVRLAALFKDEGNGGTIVCSSVHKAKGLEAARVFVLRDTLYPKRPKDAKPRTPKQLQEEANIEYVAVTRAMQTLVWVDGKPA